MSFITTRFPYFHQECIKQLGEEKGNEMYQFACEKLDSMKKQADYKGSKAIQRHMDTNMLPMIAIYLAFSERYGNQQEAYDFALEIAQIQARKDRDKNASLGKLPFGYFLFKLFCKSVMNRDFPKDGWDVEWRSYNNKEIHFDMKSCIYSEVTRQYQCPELCPVFCANDTTIFEGYKPSVIFERSGTIAEGYQLCDFHFKNSKFFG